MRFSRKEEQKERASWNDASVSNVPNSQHQNESITKPTDSTTSTANSVAEQKKPVEDLNLNPVLSFQKLGQRQEIEEEDDDDD